MDPRRFDALARAVATRRDTARGLAALAAGTALGGRLAVSPSAATAARGSFGCTKQDNSCAAGTLEGVPCPDAPSGGTCLTRNGKPLCVEASDCYPCKKNADCHETHGATALCIKCPYCKQLSSTLKTTCARPLQR